MTVVLSQDDRGPRTEAGRQIEIVLAWISMVTAVVASETCWKPELIFRER